MRAVRGRIDYVNDMHVNTSICTLVIMYVYVLYSDSSVVHVVLVLRCISISVRVQQQRDVIRVCAALGSSFRHRVVATSGYFGNYSFK